MWCRWLGLKVGDDRDARIVLQWTFDNRNLQVLRPKEEGEREKQKCVCAYRGTPCGRKEKGMRIAAVRRGGAAARCPRVRTRPRAPQATLVAAAASMQPSIRSTYHAAIAGPLTTDDVRSFTSHSTGTPNSPRSLRTTGSTSAGFGVATPSSGYLSPRACHLPRPRT